MFFWRNDIYISVTGKALLTKTNHRSLLVLTTGMHMGTYAGVRILWHSNSNVV